MSEQTVGPRNPELPPEATIVLSVMETMASSLVPLEHGEAEVLLARPIELPSGKYVLQMGGHACSLRLTETGGNAEGREITLLSSKERLDGDETVPFELSKMTRQTHASEIMTADDASFASRMFAEFQYARAEQLSPEHVASAKARVIVVMRAMTNTIRDASAGGAERVKARTIRSPGGLYRFTNPLVNVAGVTVGNQEVLPTSVGYELHYSWVPDLDASYDGSVMKEEVSRWGGHRNPDLIDLSDVRFAERMLARLPEVLENEK